MTSGIAARLAPLSLVLFLASIAAYAVLARQALNSAPLPSLLTFPLTVLVVFVVHEALHGAGFLMFGGRPRFGAGFRGGAPYLFTMCPGKRFGWGRFIVIGALPLVAIDVAALAIAWYSTLTVAAMLAFAFNTSFAVGDLWIIALILQSPRTASFECDEVPSIIAWPSPEAPSTGRLPRGLDPHGFEWVVNWGALALGLFISLFFAMSLIVVEVARHAANGRLVVGNVELASATTTNGHFSARATAWLLLLAAAILAFTLTWAVRRAVALTRRRTAGR